MASQVAQPTDLTLRPGTGILFTPRQILKTAKHSRSGSKLSRKSFDLGFTPSGRAASSSPNLSPPLPSASLDAKLSVIEVEQILREQIKKFYTDLKQACQNYDIDQSLTITKGELRRVLDTFCLPMTTDQFNSVMAKVPTNTNGTVNYCMFLDRFINTGAVSRESWKMGSGYKYSYTKSPADMGIDVIERQLRDKIAVNTKNFMKAVRLFDYNRDGRIQKHELRKVIENYCFRMTDEQYDRLWARYDFHHSGIVNYYDFLQRLGVLVQKHSKAFPEHGKFAQSWNQRQDDRTKHVEQMAIINRTDDAVRGMSYKQLEAEFRNRMKDNYVNIKKAFMAFDKRQDGFITLDDLKSVLIHFTLPMSDQLFAQLMERIGFKASHKIPWEHFLEKFLDPRIEGNGQTIPIKWNHRVNPIREGDGEMDAAEILSLLHKHVTNMYPSIKEAFLAFDQNRDGKVTRKELRKIMDKFTIRLTDAQFKVIVEKLDPEKNNAIDYHDFLGLFEVRETEEGHKWLNSEHRWNDVAPANLAWETIEEILREKIEEHWKSISALYKQADPAGTGAISLPQLRKILSKCVLPVAEDHLEDMWLRCEETEGKIMFGDFLQMLKVEVSPGDLVGTSTHIQVLSDLNEQQRQVDVDTRLHQIQVNALNRTTLMNADEVILKLKDRMAQKSSKLRDNFLRYCKDRRGKLSKKEFRQVIQSFGMYMDDDQFALLCKQLGFDRGSLTYTDFIDSFEDMRIGGPGQEITRSPNHWWKKLESQHMSAKEMLANLGDKMRQAFGDLRSTFYKLDDDHDGIVRRQDFQRLVDQLMFISTEDEFIKLMSALGISKKTRLNYQEFLDLFEVRDSPEGHKWLDSDHRWNTTIDPAQLAAEQVHEILAAKAQRQYHDLAKAFRSIDKNGNGVIIKKELRDLLYTFMLPMTKDEFTKLWAIYDPNGKGYIDHQHFLKMMGKEFAPGDDGGVSKRITQESSDTLESHHQAQLDKQINITINQASKGAFISVDKLLQDLKDRMRDKYGTFQEAFAQLDKSKTGRITITELQDVLLSHNYLVDDDTLEKFLKRIRLPTNKSTLNYEEFLKAFDEGREERYQKKNLPEVRPEMFSGLTSDKALRKLRKQVQQNVSTLQAAFGAFDKDKRGRLSPGDFRRVLDHFCFKMTDKQFKSLMSKLRVNSDLTISYPAFLEEFSANEQELAQNWIESVQKSDAQNNNHHSPTMDEIKQDLRQLVKARFYRFAERFAEIDYANIGVVAHDDFNAILNELAFRLSIDQFNKLWSSFELNSYGNLDYQAFLKEYGEWEDDVFQEGDEFLSQTKGSRPGSIMKGPGTPLVPMTPLSRMTFTPAGRRSMTPLVNAENAEHRLKRQIQKHWQEVHRLCKLHDLDNSGEVEVDAFREILSQFNVSMTVEDFSKLVTKFDLKENGKFSYLEFLKHFMLNLKKINEEPEHRTLLSREKIHQSKIVIKPESRMSGATMEAMLRIRDTIVNNWKKMRRTFRLLDPTADGVITTNQFRDTLRQFSINLSEEEFYQLTTYYDKSLQGRIPYNDFIRAFLQ
ncbi:EF-hand calcium-binding domain-containing protein 6-like isoform X1 [Lytechinus pictus]|uniref:EF-hand calcium-binding domain-containing protein 6-like isoform X1 n=1 Tax=Lytechinus pictus TaxID=7653 RepID=UPI0030B9B3CE